MCLFPIRIRTRPKVGSGELVTVSCGRCLECLKQKSVEWAFRILDECSVHTSNCFLTLTYNDENLPSDKCVSRREVQLFMKSLRQALYPLKVRFFACGEYGKRLLRPHYHIIIFGWFPSDAWFFQHKDGSDLYRSSLVESVWKKGFSTVGKVSYDTALYCAKYMNKFLYDVSGRYKHIVAPFVQMSNRPGIGFDCVYKASLVTDRIWRNGRSCKIPRYYLKVMERDGVFLDDFKAMRQAQGELVSRVTNLDLKVKKYYSGFLSKRLSDIDLARLRRMHSDGF